MTFETRHTITSNKSAKECTFKDEKNEAIHWCIRSEREQAQEILKIKEVLSWTEAVSPKHVVTEEHKTWLISADFMKKT